MAEGNLKAIESAPQTADALARVHANARQVGPVAAQAAFDTALIPQFAGNLAVQRLLRAGAIQAKLAISQPGDPDEQEADRVAERALAAPADGVQHRCAGGRDECPAEESVIHRSVGAGAGGHAKTPAAFGGPTSFGGGHPLDPATRAFMEPRFGRDFGGVQVHTGAEAAESARALDARAYTYGDNIVFAAGAYRPDSAAGRSLLAHELAHVVQQGQRSNPAAIRRQMADQPAPDATPPAGQPVPDATPPAGQPALNHAAGLIVDDGAQDLEPNQMQRGRFLAQLRSAVHAAADQALAASSLAAVMRPQVDQQIEALLGAASGQDGPTLERSLRGQIPGAAGVNNAAAFIALVAEQVRQRVTEGLPKDDGGAGLLQSGMSALGGIAQNVVGKLARFGGLLFKAKEGGSPRSPDPRPVKAILGEGRGLDSTTRSGMESAFGLDFSGVRMHTGARAAALTANLNARAFTVGSDIAFGNGEYDPGTPTGDALMAHELAHVAQQRGAVADTGGGGQSALEEDADTAAVSAVASLWTGTKDLLALIGRNAMPTLRSGLRLQRCGSRAPTRQEEKEQQDKLGKAIKEKMDALNKGGNSLDNGVWYWPAYRDACEQDATGAHHWDEAKYRLGYTAAPQFQKAGDFRWTLRAGASAAAGVQAWLQGLTVAECASSATAIYYDALRQAVGDDKFDDYFSADKKSKKRILVISQYPSETPLKDFLSNTESMGGLVEGDWYYWKNHPAYKFKHPAGLWQGENAVYMGKEGGVDKWRGFGVQKIDGQQMLKELLDAYNGSRDPSDLSKLEEKKQNGVLPPEYRYKTDGGTLDENLGEDPKVIEQSGGGLQAEGWRLNFMQIHLLKNK